MSGRRCEGTGLCGRGGSHAWRRGAVPGCSESALQTQGSGASLERLPLQNGVNCLRQQACHLVCGSGASRVTRSTELMFAVEETTPCPLLSPPEKLLTLIRLKPFELLAGRCACKAKGVIRLAGTFLLRLKKAIR